MDEVIHQAAMAAGAGYIAFNGSEPKYTFTAEQLAAFHAAAQQAQQQAQDGAQA